MDGLPCGTEGGWSIFPIEVLAPFARGCTLQRIVVPQLGISCPGGLIAEWYVPDGAPVRAGEPLYRLEAEFAAVDVEAELDGTVRHLVPAGIPQFSGELIGVILAAGERMPSEEELQLGTKAREPEAAEPPPGGGTPERPEAAGAPAGRQIRRETRAGGPSVLPPYEPPRDPLPLRPRRHREDAEEARTVRGGLWDAMLGGARPGFSWDEGDAEPQEESRPPRSEGRERLQRGPAEEESRGAPAEEPGVGSAEPAGQHESAALRPEEETSGDVPAGAAEEEPPVVVPWRRARDAAERTSEPAPETGAPGWESFLAAEERPAPRDGAAPAAEAAPAGLAPSPIVVRAVVSLGDTHRLVRTLRRSGHRGATVEAIAVWAFAHALDGVGRGPKRVRLEWLQDGAVAAVESPLALSLPEIAAALQAELPEGEPEAAVISARGTPIEELSPGAAVRVPTMVIGHPSWRPSRRRDGDLEWRPSATITLALPPDTSLTAATEILRTLVEALENPYALLAA